MPILPLLVLLALFAFTFSQNKKRQRTAAVLSAALAPGVTVMTSGGIYGTVRSIDGDVVMLEVSPGTTLRIAKGAIGRIIESPIVDVVDTPAMLPDAGSTGISDEDHA
jgi:preprotein translocase subunit YajC